MKGKRIALCLILTASAGCFSTKGFEGAAPDGVSVATVRADGVTVDAVNGKSVSMFSHLVKVLPGKNELQISGNASNFGSVDTVPPTYLLQFDAEQGVDYVITGFRGAGRVCAYKINPQNGDPEIRHSAGCVVEQIGGAY